MSDEENRRQRILHKVISNVTTTFEGCWLWTGPDSGTGRGGGYPRMSLDGQTVAVHRVIYTEFYGYIPSKKQIDHVCRNRMCVNPEHLEMVTHKENQKRRAKAKADQWTPEEIDEMMSKGPISGLAIRRLVDYGQQVAQEENKFPMEDSGIDDPLGR